jgi:hypothetical protein
MIKQITMFDLALFVYFDCNFVFSYFSLLNFLKNEFFINLQSSNTTLTHDEVSNEKAVNINELLEECYLTIKLR